MIRYNLPPDHLLYIKEHPVGLAKRKINFYKKINNKTKVRLIDIECSSQDLILNSECVISVTGTACLEAFFLKKPSFTIGDAFFSDFLVNNFKMLKENKLLIPNDNQIKDVLNLIKSNSDDFIAFTPDYYNITDKKNIERYIKALEKFLLENGIIDSIK